MAASDRVRILNGALDESVNGEIILRGVIDPDTFRYIQVPSYQREPLPLPSLMGIVKALEKGDKVADVTLGMHGGDFLERAGVFHLRNDVVVIDGLQRITSAMHLISSGGRKDPHLGCICYFNTDEESEKDLFRILNTSSNKLAPSVLIRNLKDSNEAISTIYSLTKDKTCVLYDRVCWQQRMHRHELMTALVLIKTIAHLHSGYGPCLASRYLDISNGLLHVERNVVGRNIFRENIRTFFDLIDAAWGIRSIAYKAEATWMKGNFLMGTALMLAQYRNFWDPNRRLVVSADFRKKLSTFPVNDPSIRTAAAGGGPGRKAIYRALVDHLNSGRRSGRLIPFRDADIPVDESNEDDDETAGAVA